MARGVNDIHIIGNLGADPEVRHTPSGAMVCNLRVAVTRSGGRDNEEVTDWFRVVTWEKLAETCDKYLKKGSKVYLRGEMRSSKYKPKDSDVEVTSWELNAFQMQMLDARQDGDRDRDDDRPAARRDRDDDRGRDRDRGDRGRDRDRDDDRRATSSRRSSRDDEDDEDDEPAPPKSRGSGRYAERR